ncbi:hypothetical protein [Legionella fairfieldensis]|uniref:hypothetical protein n=1 Tax=Legionella fairfieldensis TaxID=45064 RepID=UPI00048F749C|nr:hypothetical protein [Legionella fairfieldensis]
MLQNQGFGIINSILKILKKLNIFFSRFNPRYQLSLDDYYYDIKEKKIKYRFKSFGDHSFPVFTFKEIKYNSSILFSINPYDLIKIAENNHMQQQLKNQLKIDEFLRNNLYKLSNEEDSNTFSGDEICDNPLLSDKIIKSDLFKIAYNTGFERGRKISKLVINETKDDNIEHNIVQLKCLINNKLLNK